jgi:hypothetical protein
MSSGRAAVSGEPRHRTLPRSVRDISMPLMCQRSHRNSRVSRTQFHKRRIKLIEVRQASGSHLDNKIFASRRVAALRSWRSPPRRFAEAAEVIIVGMFLWAPIFMRFLYGWPPIPLEDLCDKWHFIRCPRGFPNFDPAQCIGVQAQMLAANGAAGAGGSAEMLDIIMLAIGLGFFALSVGYAIACDQL